MNQYKPLPMKIVFKGEVSTRGEATGLLNTPGDVVIIRRGHLRLFIIACPDGCGAVIPINLDPGAGKAWKLYITNRGLSLYPSVWRDSGCGSHFIVWDGALFLFKDDSSSYSSNREDEDLEMRIVLIVKRFGPTAFEVLADHLDEVPWAVLEAARRLVHNGQLVEVRKGVFQTQASNS